MKIRLALFVEDEVYKERFSTYFSRYYGDKIELNTYSDAQYVEKAIQRRKIDALLLDSATKTEFDKELFETIPVLYLSDGYDASFDKNDRVIKKYQKAGNIYKLVLNAVADMNKLNGFYGDNEKNGKVMLFQGINGGAGATSVSLAFAYNLAKKGKSVLWLDFEELSCTNVFLNADGDYGLEDILFALKRKKGNLMLKVESCLKVSDGIYYFEPCKNATDLISLKNDEIEEFIATLSQSSKFDYILIDKNMKLSDEDFWISLVEEVFFVSDGTQISNMKIDVLQKALKRMEETQDLDLLNKCHIFYNRFSKKTSTSIECDIPTLGGLPKFEMKGSAMELVRVMGNEKVWDNLTR